MVVTTWGPEQREVPGLNFQRQVSFMILTPQKPL